MFNSRYPAPIYAAPPEPLTWLSSAATKLVSQMTMTGGLTAAMCAQPLQIKARNDRHRSRRQHVAPQQRRARHYSRARSNVWHYASVCSRTSQIWATGRLSYAHSYIDDGGLLIHNFQMVLCGACHEPAHDPLSMMLAEHHRRTVPSGAEQMFGGFVNPNKVCSANSDDG